jgi:hypothetical protein
MFQNGRNKKATPRREADAETRAKFVGKVQKVFVE